LPSPATGAVVTHVHPFPGLAGGLVLPGDQLLWLDDRAKTPGHLDATEAPFGTIDRVASEAGGSHLNTFQGLSALGAVSRWAHHQRKRV
jgi:hypothetical protein